MPDAGAGSGVFTSGATADAGLRARAFRLRAALLAGCVAATVLAAWVGEPEPRFIADPELARLLRGMALIKAGIVLVGLALLLWRFGRAVPAGIAAIYMAGTWLAAAASMLIWQLAFIPFAAAAFHLGEFAVLVAAWRDMPRRLGRTAARRSARG